MSGCGLLSFSSLSFYALYMFFWLHLFERTLGSVVVSPSKPCSSQQTQGNNLRATTSRKQQPKRAFADEHPNIIRRKLRRCRRFCFFRTCRKEIHRRWNYCRNPIGCTDDESHFTNNDRLFDGRKEGLRKFAAPGRRLDPRLEASPGVEHKIG